MNEPEVLDALVQTWVRDVAPHVRPDCCILGARVTVGVLGYFNITAKALPCHALVANDEAAQLIATEVPTTEWPTSAWSIGTHTEPRPGGGYAGHVIARTASGTLVDLSARQFHRTGRIEVDGPRVWRADVIEEREGLFIVHDGGTWWRFEPTRDRTFRNTPDWRNANNTIGRTIRTINNNRKGHN